MQLSFMSYLQLQDLANPRLEGAFIVAFVGLLHVCWLAGFPGGCRGADPLRRRMYAGSVISNPFWLSARGQGQSERGRAVHVPERTAQHCCPCPAREARALPTCLRVHDEETRGRVSARRKIMVAGTQSRDWMLATGELVCS
jgi:hypothetical protein